MVRLLSKKNRVLAVITLMAASSLGAVAAVLVVTTSETAELIAARAVLSETHELAHDLAVAVRVQEAAISDYILSVSPIALRRFDEAVAREGEIADQLRVVDKLPRVHSALEALAAASLEWRTKVALPAVRAVQHGDAVGVARFGAQSADDHRTIETAADLLNAELEMADAALMERQAGLTTMRLVAVAIGFGFLLVAFGVALVAVWRFGQALELDARHASVLNRFTEVTSFTNDNREVAAANLTALGRLAGPDASVTHILNRSMDRAIPEARTGDAVAEVLPLHTLGRCAGVLRGTMYVADDLADDLSVRCPIYPAPRGTLACVPLVSGESVGAVHLYWTRPNALPLAIRSSIARITEHAAMAIGNQRLLAALHGQANTDARTGLANSRSFDLAVEAALAARSEGETLSILMIDVDHFKDFNDRHGHPAGDEALRAFGGILRSCMRESDLAARYGGEEFAVLLRGPGHDVATAATIAERIRARTEVTIIPLSPGVTDRITVSVGIATAPDHGSSRVTLLRVADEALYRAKEGGRNRVVGIEDPPVPPVRAGIALA